MDIWRRYTGREVGPSRLRVWFFSVLAVLLGYTFVIKLMEIYEGFSSEKYRDLVAKVPELREMLEQEEEHEDKLIGMLDEERLRYVGSMMLGLNDALVELTGTLAGLTFAFANNRLVALVGVVTGVSAALSMAASTYLAERTSGDRNAVKSSLYTGAAYLVTVACLVAPYLLLPNGMYVHALVAMLAAAILIILAFNYYISVAKSLPFLRRFGEMALISLGVAFASFVIGALARSFLGIDL